VAGIAAKGLSSIPQALVDRLYGWYSRDTIVLTSTNSPGTDALHFYDSVIVARQSPKPGRTIGDRRAFILTPHAAGFFVKLRDHKIPVSIKEWLTLLEAMQKTFISPSIDEFYYLSRTTLVKDEQNFDKFDGAFGEYFKGIESVAGVELDVPLEWLLKQAS